MRTRQESVNGFCRFHDWMKMKKFFTFVFLYLIILVFSAHSNQNLLHVLAIVNPSSSLAIDEPTEFLVVDKNGDLIPNKEIGNVVVVSNYPTWKLVVSSEHDITPNQGRLKLDNYEIYIPYTFTIKDGEMTIVNQFDIRSAPQSITPVSGRPLTLQLYFADDDTIWPQGTYSDTLVLSITSD
jgi:hypothetical protein